MLGFARGRRGFREDAIYFDHSGDCHDVQHHSGCPGRWRGAASVGYGADGKRVRRKVSGRTRQEVKDKLAGLHSDTGCRNPSAWLAVHAGPGGHGLDGRSEKTLALNRHVLQPVVDSTGRTALRDLTSWDVRRVLTEIAATHSTRTIASPTTR